MEEKKKDEKTVKQELIQKLRPKIQHILEHHIAIQKSQAEKHLISLEKFNKKTETIKKNMEQV